MPSLGEIQRGRDIGRVGKTPSTQFKKWIWLGCKVCGKERWVPYITHKGRSERCLRCAMLGHSTSQATRAKIAATARSQHRYGERSPCWKGGRSIDGYGYVLVTIPPTDWFFPMSVRGRIKEHRLIMARQLGRHLLPWEVVHHRNGNKQDNRLENLLLITGHQRHLPFTLLEKENKRLRERIQYLEQKLAGHE